LFSNDLFRIKRSTIKKTGHLALGYHEVTERTMPDNILQVEDLSLRRAGRDILRHVNLVVRAGEVHALLGLNGSGKSSLAYALMGCAGYAPDAGRLVFDERDITALAISERARLGMTLAWQEPARFEGLPVTQYVFLGAPAAKRERIREVLEAVALPPSIYARRAVDQTLSGGERKRVELAAVFAMRPRLAILDEPDSGIDALSLADVGALIRRMASEGTAVLLITHRDEMVGAADTASLMCQGTILFSGDPAEARRYYGTRCRPHIERLGTQPWDEQLPEVQAALASDGTKTE
jgi:Fe-S cluster assembly ATP-binding protein